MLKNHGSTQYVTAALLFQFTVPQQHPGEGRGAGEGLAERRVAGPPVLTATASLEKKPLQSHLTSGQKPGGLSDGKLSHCF